MTFQPPDIATQLADAAHAFARGDDASMDLITNAVRELRQHEAARNAETWPMCDADAERMEKAVVAIETLTREREAAFNIATRRTEEHMQFQLERDAAREALKDAAHRVRWLMQFVTDTAPIEAELAKWDALATAKKSAHE